MTYSKTVFIPESSRHPAGQAVVSSKKANSTTTGCFWILYSGKKRVGSPTVNVSFTFDVKVICSNNQYCKKPLSKSNITTSKSCSYKDGDGRWFWYCIPVDSTFPDFYWVKRPWNRKIKSLLVSELIIFIAYSHSRGWVLFALFLRDGKPKKIRNAD